ncbi:hypothetical protein SALBM311S_10370 [Streptomyces alboniger]
MTVEPVPAMSCMASEMTLRNASASQEAPSRSKKKAWWSSSGRTYRACSRAVGTETSPTSSRSRPSRAAYPSHTDRQCRHTSCTSGWFQASGLTESRVRASASGSGESGRSGCLKRPAATSMRKPSTPRSSQKRSVRSNSSATSGVRQFQSGCSGVNMCRYHWPGRPSASVTRLQAGPPNMACQLLGGSAPSGPRPSAKWKRSLAALPGAAASASWNHGCSLEQWFGTMSRSTLMPSRRAAAISESNSARSPKVGSTSQ